MVPSRATAVLNSSKLLLGAGGGGGGVATGLIVSVIVCVLEPYPSLVLVELSPLTPQLPGAEGDRGDLQASHAERDGVQDAGRHGAPFLAESL
jgi:hypothetical protein